MSTARAEKAKAAAEQALGMKVKGHIAAKPGVEEVQASTPARRVISMAGNGRPRGYFTFRCLIPEEYMPALIRAAEAAKADGQLIREKRQRLHSAFLQQEIGFLLEDIFTA